MEQKKEECMPYKHSHTHGAGGGPALGGAFWFAGWLFTSSFLNLVWWKWIVGIVIWPYFMGVALR
jgi:hypothetical protein